MEVNCLSMLHKNADDYSRLALKIMLFAYDFEWLSLGNFHKDKNIFSFFSHSFMLKLGMQQSKKSFIKFKFIVCDEVIVSCFFAFISSRLRFVVEIFHTTATSSNLKQVLR